MTVDAPVQLPEKWANPEILTWARTRMGLGPQEVESLTGIAAERVLYLEMDKAAPSLLELETLAGVYDCPVGYFFLDLPPEERQSLDFRCLTAEKVETLSYETHVHLNEFLKLTDYLTYLVEQVGLPHQVEIETADVDESVESVARRERERFGYSPSVRGKWATPDDAFSFWREQIESRGVFVIALRLKTSEVRGASRWDSPRTPAILVNRMDMEASTGRTFTLLHEWGHLIAKHTGMVCDFRGQPKAAKVEHFANKFAAEMLVPVDELETYLKQSGLFSKRARWGDDKIDEIRHEFKASRDVIAILLEEMAIAPSGFYRSKRASWDLRKPFFRNLGGGRPGRTKAARRLTELGHSAASLVSTAYESGGISKLDLADVLNMKVEQAEGFVSWLRGNPGDQALE